MENHHVQWENPLYMAIFNSYFDITRGYVSPYVDIQSPCLVRVIPMNNEDGVLTWAVPVTSDKYNHPRCTMYGIFTYIYPKNGPNVGKYSIHGASGHSFIVYGGYIMLYPNLLRLPPWLYQYPWSCHHNCTPYSPWEVVYPITRPIAPWNPMKLH